MSDDTVKLYGIKDGVETYLGEIRTPPKMKAREIVARYFGAVTTDDETAGTDGAMALWACEELIDWMENGNKT